jgi:hypothetical protein
MKTWENWEDCQWLGQRMIAFLRHLYRGITGEWEVLGREEFGLATQGRVTIIPFRC